MRHLKRYGQLFESTQELTQEQKDWLDKCAKRTWSVNPKTGLVDVDGTFNCSNQGLTDFKGVRFGKVSGNFNCFENKLTSLDGAPQMVGRSFSCYTNDLASLEGLPEGFSVGGNFNCFRNNLTSLKGLPKGFSVGYFRCSNNDLTSLKGLPEGFSFDRDFDCSDNNLTSLEGALQSIGGNIVCSGNPISEGSIGRILRRMSDKKISLEQAVLDLWEEMPEEDQIYLAKHNPDITPEEKRIYRAIELNMKRR